MTLHLSRLFLDPMSRQVQNELRAPYEMHRTLCHAFPNLSPKEWENARVLFRVDQDNERLCLIVQSKIAPDWDAFIRHMGEKRYLLGQVDAKSRELTFSSRQLLRFRLLANPTFRPKRPDGQDGERTGLYREHERLDWLRRQGERLGFGFELQEVTLRPIDLPDGKVKPVIHPGKEYREELPLLLPPVEIVDLNAGPPVRGASSHDSWRSHRMPSGFGDVTAEKTSPKFQFGAQQFSAARFDGILTVADPDKFRVALENGIGPAKGFGFGLLSLARA